MTCCPTCNRPLPKPKATAELVDTAGLTDAELYAYHKRIAPKFYLDRFLERAHMSAELRDRAEHNRRLGLPFVDDDTSDMEIAS